MPQNPLARIVAWLRAGYPDGVPQGDYVALLGILHRSLTDAEVEQIVLALTRSPGSADGRIDPDEVRAAIRRHIHEEPSAEDVERVFQHIDSGWRAQHPGTGTGD